MTALEQYERLETTGLWRAEPNAQRREVIVSFGHATLVMTDSAGRVLTHWSLPAVVRLNEGERPAIFAPAEDADETLEIEDTTMIDAVEKIRRALLKSGPHPGRLRVGLILGGFALVAALALLWFPNAVRQQALSVVPQAKRVEYGTTILAHLQSKHGQQCESAQGTLGLAQLNTRLFGSETGTTLAVLPTGVDTAMALPGGIIVLDRVRVETTDDPAVVAGYVLAAHTDRLENDPLAAVIEHAGLRATLRLLTTGDLPAEYLQSFADVQMPVSAPNVPLNALAQTFDLAQIPTIPYINDMEERGYSIDLEDNSATLQETPTMLSDGAWVALKGICDG